MLKDLSDEYIIQRMGYIIHYIKNEVYEKDFSYPETWMLIYKDVLINRRQRKILRIKNKINESKL